MEFRTKIQVDRQAHNLVDYQSRIFLVGSCFSDHIGSLLGEHQFQTLSNSHGVLFQSLAIEQYIARAINLDYYSEKDLVLVNGLYCCLEAHSSFNHKDSRAAVEKLNQSLERTKSWLEQASHVVITLGTAWVYRFLETDNIVANCHKIPQKKFSKELLKFEEVKNSLEAIVSLISTINPNVVYLFTVSPVRHLKDGFTENNRSKAHLLAAVHELVEEHNKSYYFPSFELIIDELRDYRFFKKDMVHPTDQAVEYIWSYFINSWMSEEAKLICKEVKSLLQGVNHKAFNPDSNQHQKFLKDLEVKRVKLQQRIPHLKL